MTKATVLLCLLTAVCAAGMPAIAGPASQLDSLLHHARLLYYESVDDQDKIDSAVALFTRMAELDPRLRGRAMTYIGSLTALRAKYAFWPQEKWRVAWDGLRLMDQGLALDSLDVESLFVHGTTCYYLPVFFGRAQMAQRNLREIVRLLPDQAHNYDPDLVAHAIHFIVNAMRLNRKESRMLHELSLRLAQR